MMKFTIVPDRLQYLKNLLLFAVRNNPLLYLNMPLMVLSAGVEILAMSILIPLSTLATGQELAGDTFWERVLANMGLSMTPSSLLMLFFIVFSIRIVTQLVSQNLTFYLGTKIQAELSAQAFAKVVKSYSLREIEEKTAGFFIGIAGDEASRAGTIITSINQFFALFVLALFYFLTIVYYSAVTAIAVVVFLAVSFVCLMGAFGKSHQLGERQIDQRRTAYSVFLDSLNGLRTIRAFTATDYVARDYDEIISRYAKTAFHIESLNLLARSVPVLILFASAGIFVALGLVQLESSEQFAFLITILIYLMRFFPAVGQCLNILMRTIADTKAGKDVTAVIESGSATEKTIDTEVLAESVEEVRCKDIGFAYESNKWILRHLNMTLERGKSYALMGPSGSGKSTLLDLLVGLYEPSEGNVYINGAPIDKFDISSLRNKVILLGQRTTVFSSSVAENVKLGAKNVNINDVRRACSLACIDEHIQSLRHGYETVLAYQGTNFSGGQLQRLGVARALIRSPDVLVLDESTSAIDASTRGKLVDNILKEYEHRIVVFVTHDKAIIEKVNSVIEMREVNTVSPTHARKTENVRVLGESSFGT